MLYWTSVSPSLRDGDIPAYLYNRVIFESGDIPDPSRPGSSRPISAGPGPVSAGPSRLRSAQPGLSRPEPVRPVLARPVPACLSPARLGPSQPDSSRNGPFRPVPVRHVPARPVPARPSRPGGEYQCSIIIHNKLLKSVKFLTSKKSRNLDEFE